MSLLKHLLLAGGGGAGKAPLIFPIEYTFVEGTASLYDLFYDNAAGDGPFLIASPSDYFNINVINSQRKIARLSDRKLYVIYHSKAVNNYQMYVKESSDEGATWVNETAVGTGWVDASRTSGRGCLIVDSSDNLHAIWIGIVGAVKQILYSYFNGTSWSAEVVISTGVAGMTTRHSEHQALILDASDNLHAVWRARTNAYPTESQLYYSKKTAGGAWSVPVRISDYAGMENYYQKNPSIAVDSNGHVHVVWTGEATGFTAGDQLWYTKYDGSWSAPIRIATFECAGRDLYTPCIAIDSSDNLHVVWSSMTTSYPAIIQIWYTKYDGSWLSPPTRLSTYANMNALGHHQWYPTIGVDENDYLYVAWHGLATGYAVATIWLATYITSWSAPSPVQSTGTNQQPIVRWRLFP